MDKYISFSIGQLDSLDKLVQSNDPDSLLIVNPFDPTGYLMSLSCNTLRSGRLQKEPGIAMQLVTAMRLI